MYYLSFPVYPKYIKVNIPSNRRINTPIDRAVKLVEPHRLGSAQFGAMCPVESPDGGNIGLLKHFPVFTHVSYDIDTKDIVECCRDHGMLYLSEIAYRGEAKCALQLGRMMQEASRVAHLHMQCDAHRGHHHAQHSAHVVCVCVPVLCDMVNVVTVMSSHVQI